VLLQSHTEEKADVEQEREESKGHQKAPLGGAEANDQMEEEDNVEAEEEDDGDVADEEDEDEEEEEDEQGIEQDNVTTGCNESDSITVSENAETVKDEERAEDVQQRDEDTSKGAEGEIGELEVSRLLDKTRNEDWPNHDTSLDMLRDRREEENKDWTDSPLVTWTTVSRRRGRGARHPDKTQAPCPLRPLDKQNPAIAPRQLCQAPEPQLEGTSTTEATDQSTGDCSAGSSIGSPRSAPGLRRDEEHEVQPSRSRGEYSEDDHIDVEFCVVVKNTFLHAERVVPQAHRRARSAGGRLSSSFAEQHA